MCGGIRYELTAVPHRAGWCHCTRCRRRTGTPASVSARIVPGSLRIVAGEALLRSWQPGDGWAKVFCSRCGSQMWSQDPRDPEAVSVRMGSFDGDPGVRPSYHHFVNYAAPWAPLPDDGLPRYPERHPG